MVTQWRYCKRSKDWRGQTYPQPLLLRSEISLFWRTSCVRNFSSFTYPTHPLKSKTISSCYFFLWIIEATLTMEDAILISVIFLTSQRGSYIFCLRHGMKACLLGAFTVSVHFFRYARRSFSIAFFRIIISIFLNKYFLESVCHVLECKFYNLL